MSDRSIERWATFSAHRSNRFSLGRLWDHELPRMCWVMLNPSIADHQQDDPTIRRCMGFARRENCGSIEVVNLLSYRATNPRHIGADIYLRPVLRENHEAIEAAVWRSDFVVAAWGANKLVESPAGRASAELVDSAAGDFFRSLICLGTTKAGHPRHPLYVKSTQALDPFWLRRCDGEG